MMKLAIALVLGATACQTQAASSPDGPTTEIDAAPSSDAPDQGFTPRGLGIVSNAVGLSSCMGAPAGSSCMQVTVSGCPEIENASINVIIAILPSTGLSQGTIVHFSGGDGTTFNPLGATEYQTAHFTQVFARWTTPWEITPAQGIKAAACRPATLLKWIFDEPMLQAGSRAKAFCAEGHSGGTAQIGYSLAQYGLSDYLDYANEISGPPFARIDLGCDGNAPKTAEICGVSVKTNLPGPELDSWENNQAPSTCGSTNVTAAELARWKNDSVAIGGNYFYPKTLVKFFTCTNNATAVTAMSAIYAGTISDASNGDPARVTSRCYSAADGCMGEGLGVQGGHDAIQAMIDNCVPLHQ